MRISIREHKDKEFNIKVHESFNVFQLIMHTSMNEREFSTIFENTEYKIGVSKYSDD